MLQIKTHHLVVQCTKFVKKEFLELMSFFRDKHTDKKVYLSQCQSFFVNKDH